MASCNAVLAALAAAKSPMTAGELLSAIQPGAGGAGCRRGALATLARLMQRGFAEQLPRPKQKAFGDPPTEARYQVTIEGRSFHKSGGTITSGKTGARNGNRKCSVEPGYAKIWSALRFMPGKTGSTQQLLEVAQIEAPRVALRYLKALCAAGVARRLRGRQPGFSPNSNGFACFAIINDLGPLAPLMRKKGLVNPNDEGRLIPFLPKKEAA